MAVARFLSEATLKSQSVIQDNVDMKVVTPTIFDVQNMFILPILGTSLYNDISAKILADAMTPDYINLMDNYITPTMVWYIRFELPLALNFKYFNKGVGTQDSDNMTPASSQDMSTLMDHTRNKAEWYAERLTRFLQANPTLFPLYNSQSNTGIDTIFPKRTNFTSGMVLDDGDCCAGEHNFKNIPIAPAEIRKPCCL